MSIKGVVHNGDRLATTRQVVTASVVVLLLSAAGSSGAAWLSGHFNKEQTKRSTLATCLSGGEFRILVALSNDRLRRGAVGLVPGARPNPRVEAFLRSSQPAINDFLSQAAGQAIQAPQPGGEVTDALIQRVRVLSVKRCEKRSDDAASGPR